MKQGYMPSEYLKTRKRNNDQRKIKKTKIWAIIAVIIIIVVIAIGITAIIGAKPGPGSPNYVTPLDAAGFYFIFDAMDLPVYNLIIYDEETDPNNLLGRPHSYISKVNFADERIDQYSADDPLGGTVEVFSSVKDAKARYAYCSAFSGTVFGDYCYLYGNVLLRINYNLTPVEATEYERYMLLAMGKDIDSE